MTAVSLLPPTADPFLQALSEGLAPAADLPVEILDRLWDPVRAPEQVLPALAQALGVKLWRNDWPVAKKRLAITETVALMRRRGTVEAFARFIRLVDAQLLAVHAPPQRLTPRGSRTQADRRRWARQFPLVRVWPVREPHRLPAALVVGRSAPGRAPRAGLAHLYAGLRAELELDGVASPATARSRGDGVVRIALRAKGRRFAPGCAPGRIAPVDGAEATRTFTYRTSVHGAPVVAAGGVTPYRPERSGASGRSRSALTIGHPLGRRVLPGAPIGRAIQEVRIYEPSMLGDGAPRPYGGWFAGRGRLGQDRFTLHLDVDASRKVRGRRPFPLSPGGALRPTDRAHFANILAAARAAKLGRDQVLVRTSIYHPIGPGDVVPLDGSVMPGQIVRSL